MSQKMMSLSSEQLFIAAVAYEASSCQLPMEEFLLRISDRYKEAGNAYHSLRPSYARVGKKSDLGL